MNLNDIYLAYVSVWDPNYELEDPCSAYIDVFNSLEKAKTKGLEELHKRLNDDTYDTNDLKYRFFIKFNGPCGQTFYHYNKDNILFYVSDEENDLFPTDYNIDAGTHFVVGDIVRNILNNEIYIIAGSPGQRTKENSDYWDNIYLVYSIALYDGLKYHMDHDHIHETHLVKINDCIDGSIFETLANMYKYDPDFSMPEIITNKQKKEMEEFKHE